MQGDKRLTVDMNYNQPKFTFEGMWTGKDVQIVMSLIRREYLRHQQLVRREALQPATAN